jgi:protein phosphatase 4 regulatory subunit 3
MTPIEVVFIKDYIISLIEVFKKSEDLESLNDLHALCRCMQTIRKLTPKCVFHATNGPCTVSVLLNDHTIYEHILDNRVFTGLMGILECERHQSKRRSLNLLLPR